MKRLSWLIITLIIFLTPFSTHATGSAGTNISEIQAYPSFSTGYPMLAATGKFNSITCVLKVTSPCSIYYKLVPYTQAEKSPAPKRSEINTFLANLSRADYEIKVSVPARHSTRYNLYLTLKTSDGKYGGIYTLKNISALPFLQGSGTPSAPYEIYTEYQLSQVRYYPQQCFLLCTDINCTQSWTPICEGDKNGFSGVFDGGGHTIKNLTINSDNYSGFFSRLSGGTVKNLNISGNVIGDSYVGLLAGEADKNSLIKNCHASGTVSAKKNLAGGICGKNDGTISDCLSAVYLVRSNAYSGGICGSNYGSVKSCISAVSTITSDMYASGISGVNVGGIIENCVVSCIEVSDTLTPNSGRITTAKQAGKTINNYCYENILSGINVKLGVDTDDGEDVSWEALTTADFYTKKLNWSFDKERTLKNQPQFMLPCITGVDLPILTPGLTIYAPILIENENDLKSISSDRYAHYYLARSITLSDSKSNKNIFPLFPADNDTPEQGFCGTLDGGGHTIKNLTVSYDTSRNQYGLFGTLYGATVRNLRLENVNIHGHSYVGGICAVNYGNIENCEISGQLRADFNSFETLSGSICAVNYTNISKVKSTADISVISNSVTCGGIAAQNEGFINKASYEAKITASSQKSLANAVIGGICGINTSGMIYNCFSSRLIDTDINTSYVGGICSMLLGGEIYKCSSYGNIVQAPLVPKNSVLYSGGICALSSGGIIMNCFSEQNISAKSNNSYSGGICGYSENSALQNCYAINTVNQPAANPNHSFTLFSGGICAFSDNSNISGCVAVNPYILTTGYCGKICASAAGGYIDNNYYSSSVYIGGKSSGDTVNGEKKALDILKNTDFFFTPIEKGGLLGWSNEQNGDNDAWGASGRKNYPFPVLKNVYGQNIFDSSIIYK